MTLRRLFLSAALAAGLLPLAGCPPEPIALPPQPLDSRVEYLPTIKVVDDRTLVLSDGQRVELRGITMQGLNPHEQREARRYLQQLVGGHCDMQGGGGEVHIVCYARYRGGDPSPLGPQTAFKVMADNRLKIVDPDVRAAMLAQGLVETQVDEVGPAMQQRLAAAQSYARDHALGLWRNLQHREEH